MTIMDESGFSISYYYEKNCHDFSENYFLLKNIGLGEKISVLTFSDWFNF